MTTTVGVAGPVAREGLRALFQHPRMIRDLLAAWGGYSWTHWLHLDRLTGLDRRGRPATAGRPAAFWKAPWAGGGDEVWMLVETRCEEDPALVFRLARRALHLAERLAAEAAGKESSTTYRVPLRLPLVVPLVLYAGIEPWRGPRQALDHYWPVLPGLQAFAPRAPFQLFDLRRDPFSTRADEANLVWLLRTLLESGSPRAVDAVLERLVAVIDQSGDEALRRIVSRYLGDCFLPNRFPRLFTAPESELPVRRLVLEGT